MLTAKKKKTLLVWEHCVPEGPVMLAVRLNMPKIEAETLSDIQHITEVKAYSIEEHRGHADFIQSPHIVTTAWVVRLPPAELNAKLTSAWWEFNRHNPDWWKKIIKMNKNMRLNDKLFGTNGVQIFLK